jgi:transmembrane sensor
MDKEYLIKKWLDNELSETETEAFNALEDAALYKEIIQEAKRFGGAVHAKVAPFDTIDRQLEHKKSPSVKWLQIALRIAAVFIVSIAVFTLLDEDKINTFNTKYAQNETITLPDNSIVKLNQQSQLEYNVSNWDKKRTLELKGEAFFDVEKGKRFDVNTEFGSVSVLGTEFNILSRDSIFKVSCYEGLVAVFYGSENIKLPAGTEFVLTSGNAEKTDIVIAEPYWLRDMSVFKNASIDTVFKEIENQFGITILNTYDNEKVMFTGAFEHNNLENALKAVTQPLNLEYEITSNKAVTIRHVEN